jgi:Calcineurin-like phosphoesterase superfamily domain
MQIGALGDIHGEFETVQSITQRHADVPLWVCVGDVASNDGEYFQPAAPFYFIKGNNEDFDVLAASVKGEPLAPNLHYLKNGGPHIAGPWRIAALGGTFAPSWYNTPASALPPSKGRRASGGGSLKLGKSRDDKRRHFVRDEVVACKALTNIDLFMTHEAPRPFYPAGRRIDAGKTVLNDVLAAMKPRLHLFGHHHEFTDSVRQGVRSIGLDVVTKSYLLIDAETFRTERLDT